MKGGGGIDFILLESSHAVWETPITIDIKNCNAKIERKLIYYYYY